MQPRVLIVDDDPLACRIIADTLGGMRYRVAAVPDAPSALASLASSGAPELFIIDLVLPGMNGLELLRTLAGDPRAADSALLVATGLNDRSHLMSALRLGADDFLVKPLDCNELALRVRALVTRRGGGRREVPQRRVDLAVLFADIRGFTPLTDRIDPETCVTILNDLFDTLDGAIEGEGGYVDKFIGDSVMTFFAARESLQDNALRACRAALAMQRLAQRFAAESLSLARNAQHFGIGVGVACGEAVVGMVGSTRKRSFTAIGDPVNLASRLQGLAERDEVIIDHEVALRLGQAALLSPAREVVVKGKSRPRLVYRLLDLAGA